MFICNLQSKIFQRMRKFEGWSFPAARFPALIQQMTEVAADSQFKSTKYKYRKSTQFNFVVKLQQFNSLKYNTSYYYFKIIEFITFKYCLKFLNYKTQKQQTLPSRPDQEASARAGMGKQSGFHRGRRKDAGEKTSARPLPGSHIWTI
ncbi:hypothetical protein ACFXAH_21515 [Agrobacterium deltaense]